MANEFVTLEEAAHHSGLHVNTLRRLLRQGVVQGYKTAHRGKSHWFVSMRSLRAYTDPVQGFLLELPGPKLFLKRMKDDESKE